MTDSRVRRCPTHHLRPRCPGCDSARHIPGTWQQQEVPAGFAEWLRDAAIFYAALGPISATEFAEAISADLREVAGDIPHGTRTGYIGRACRCDDCRAWRATYYNVSRA